MKSTRYKEIKMSHQVAPLIDVVFLLLIYFMVTASIVKKEGDVAFTLPVGDSPVTWPVEAFIQISDDGVVMLEGMQFGSSDHELRELVSHMKSLKFMADAQSSEFIVTLAPSGRTMHGRIIDVMDACRNANVKHLAFAQRNT